MGLVSDVELGLDYCINRSIWEANVCFVILPYFNFANTTGSQLDTIVWRGQGLVIIKAMSRPYDVLFTRCPRGGFGTFLQLPAQST